MSGPRPRGRREPSVSRQRVLPGSPALVWGIVADTNRWDRIVGWSPTTYTYELWDPSDPTSRTRIGHARYLGRAMAFAEEGDYWSGSYLRGERRFLGGFARLWSHGFLDVRVVPAPSPTTPRTTAQGPSTRVSMRVGVAPVGIAGWLVVPLVLAHLWVLLALYLRSIERALQRGAGVGATRDGSDEPAQLQARRALLSAAGGDRLTSGRRHAAASGPLRERTARFAGAPVSTDIKRRLIDLVVGQPDEALVQIKPFEQARAWGADRREVLRGFLHATRAGLFDLEWQVDCPVCRVGTAAAPTLAGVERRIHCAECDVSFDVDFAEHVHATFTANPAIRGVSRAVYCAGSPYHRPHVFGTLSVPAGAVREVGPLPPGERLLRVRGTDHVLHLPDRGQVGAAVRATAAALVADDDAAVADDHLRIQNATGVEVRLVVERAGWHADIARGSLLLRLPDFVEQFGTEAPAAGHPMSVGTLAVLFTDVVASTELYQTVGDARAYALIQAHWRDAERIAAACDGAVVKSLGDGILASFANLADATSAALAMMEHADDLARRHGHPFAIRAGLREGPCYAVRANERLDLFGTTVNLCARLTATAAGQQIALLAEDLDRPGVAARLAAAGCLVSRVRTSLRGLPGEHAIALASRGDAELAFTGEHEAPKATGS